MQRGRRFLWAVLDVGLDLLWIMGWVQPDSTLRRGRRVVVVYIIGVLLLMAFIAGLIPFWLLEKKATVEGWIAVTVGGTLSALLMIVAIAGFIQMAVLCWRG